MRPGALEAAAVGMAAAERMRTTQRHNLLFLQATPARSGLNPPTHPARLDYGSSGGKT